MHYVQTGECQRKRQSHRRYGDRDSARDARERARVTATERARTTETNTCTHTHTHTHTHTLHTLRMRVPFQD
jgi:hypothetical protein